MKGRVVTERDYTIGNDMTISIPRETIVRLHVYPKDHPSRVDEIWIAPIGDRLYTKYVSQHWPCSGTTQPEIKRRARLDVCWKLDDW